MVYISRDIYQATGPDQRLGTQALGSVAFASFWFAVCFVCENSSSGQWPNGELDTWLGNKSIQQMVESL